ncbi:MAG: universal stress protein, partial [Chromatocurvus sp.]
MKTEHTANEHKERRRQRRARKSRAGHGIQHIMVCLDGSAPAETRIAYAISLAGIFNSEITLMHVIP